MADKYTIERDRQEAEKKATEEVLEMTSPPVLTGPEIKESAELRGKQDNDIILDEYHTMDDVDIPIDLNLVNETPVKDVEETVEEILDVDHWHVLDMVPSEDDD